MQHLVIYTDGGARGNPGPAGIGAVLLDGEGAVLKEISSYIGEATNNIAEYEALIQALTAAQTIAQRSTRVDVRMDSELLVRQITGIYKVKHPALKEKFQQVKILCASFPDIEFRHIPRAQNSHADRLVNEAIDAAL